MADKIPDYAIEPLKRCLHSVFTMYKLLHLSIHGLGIISKRPEMVQRIITLTEECGQEVTEELKADLVKVTNDAGFTNSERDQDFPLLHAFTLVGIWAALESGIEDMLVGILCNEPAVLATYGFGRIRIPLSKYEQLDKEERMRFLLSELEREETSGLAQGINAFENILYVFDLSGSVSSAIRDELWKLSNLRNVIVHRDSRADRRLVENCPAMNLKIGDRVLVSHEAFASITNQVTNYIIILIRRLATRYNAPIPKWAEEFYPAAT